MTASPSAALRVQSAGGSKDTTIYTYDHNGNPIYQARETLKPINPADKPGLGEPQNGRKDAGVSHYVLVNALLHALRYGFAKILRAKALRMTGTKDAASRPLSPIIAASPLTLSF